MEKPSNSKSLITEVQTEDLHELTHDLQGVLLGFRLSFDNLVGKRPNLSEAQVVFETSEKRLAAIIEKMTVICNQQKDST